MATSISIITRNISCFLLLGSAITSCTFAVEFNTNVLKATGLADVDISAFNGDNSVFAGDYLADILINGQEIYYNYPLYIYNQDGQGHVCFTKELIEDLPLSSELSSAAKSTVINATDIGDCYGLEQYDPAILIEYDDELQRVNMRIPHAYTVDFDKYWVPPNKRDYGISGLVLDYNLLKTFSRSKSYGNTYTNNSFSSYGAMGFNIGRFRFRTNYQYNPNNHGKKFQRTQTYAFTDIGSLNAQLYAGELQSSSNIFDSVRFKGITLFTNENMMPSYLQGYAPQITGMANSTAIVTLQQYGNIIYQAQVPPGPFAINLSSITSGVIDVTVEESDGQTQNFQVDVASVPFMTRKGALRYNINIGEFDPRYTQEKVKTKFISTDGSYGLSNIVSLNGGVNYTNNSEYQAYSVGLGLNLGFAGALSFDVTRSENKANPEKQLTGQSYRFNYAKRFNQHTSLNIVGYRFSSREYTTLNNYVDMKGNSYDRLQLEKNRFSLSVSQYVPLLGISLTATGSKSTYWNRESNSYYSISASKTIQKGYFARTRLTLNLGHNKGVNHKNNTIGLYVNIPLENRGNISYSNTYSDSHNNMSQQATYYNQGFGGNYSVGVSMNGKRDFSGSVDYALNASYNTNLAFGNVSTSATYSDKQQFASANFSGSLTLTQHGLATHPYVYNDNSRLIVDTGVPDVKFVGGSSTSNIFGLAGISNVPDYSKQIYKVDNDNLPEDVEIPDNVIEIATAKGAIAYRDTNAISGTKALVTITLPDGSHPPFGATIYRENGADTEVGMVADNGLTYLAGLNKKSTFIVKWGETSCQLKINSTDPAELNNILCH